MSAKGLYINKPLQLADRLEGMGFYLDEEGAAVIRKQHAEIERLRDELRQSSIDHTRAEVERLWAECRVLVRQNKDWQEKVEALRAERDALREALDWIARVNAMDYEYQAKARAAIDAARGKT